MILILWPALAVSETKVGGARLELPLDYTEPEGEKAAVALIKVPANVSSTHANYHGPVLFNLGGPGGPGVDFIKGSR